jgi:hypothetical protein
MFNQRAEPFPTVTLPLTPPVEPFPQNLHRFPKELLQARVVAAHSIVVVSLVSANFEPVLTGQCLFLAPFGENV